MKRTYSNEFKAAFAEAHGQLGPREQTLLRYHHVDGLNIQGELCSVYLNGQIYGVDRGTAKGGDKFVFNSQTWLVVAVPEQWPDWCRVILCLQVVL